MVSLCTGITLLDDAMKVVTLLNSLAPQHSRSRPSKHCFNDALPTPRYHQPILKSHRVFQGEKFTLQPAPGVPDANLVGAINNNETFGPFFLLRSTTAAGRKLPLFLGQLSAPFCREI